IERRRIKQAINPRERQVHHAEEAEQKTDQADAAEQMLRPLAEAGEELDGHEIEEPFHEASDAVLGFAEAARAMVDLDFADGKARRGGEHRNEAMQLAVEPDLAKNLGTVTLHPAVVIVQFDAREPAHQPVEDTAWKNLVP